MNTAEISNHLWKIEEENDGLLFKPYSREELAGFRNDILLRMHTSPQTAREKEFSILIYLRSRHLNTMFLWDDTFDVKVVPA